MSDHIELRVNGLVVYDSGGQASTPTPGAVPPINTKPSPVGDLGDGSAATDWRGYVNPGQVVGLTFTCRPYHALRTIDVLADGGPWINGMSWAVFDSGGGRVLYGDNVPVEGQGLGIPTTTLAQLGNGTYTLGFAVSSANGQGGGAMSRLNQQ